MLLKFISYKVSHLML